MTRADLKSAWEKSELAICSPMKAMAEGIHPNKAGWFKADPTRAGIVFAYLSRRGSDCAVGEKALTRVREGMRTGKTRESWIIFLRRSDNSDKDEFLDAAPAETIAATFCNQTPLKGDRGNYWWIPMPISAEADEEMPF
jgi:hypothetical protein